MTVFHSPQFRRFGIMLGLLSVISIIALAATEHVSTADTVTTCNDLTAQESDDKNYYSFSATAAGSGASITGYSFDFGDHQSYSFTFGSDSSQDRNQAKVTHTYEKAGTYTARVSAITQSNGKSTSVTSPTCTASITINPPAVVLLPDTGPGSLLVLFVSCTMIGTLAYHYRQIRSLTES